MIARNPGETIGFLDIGSRRVVCIIAAPDGTGGFSALGVGEAAGEGVEDGRIADLDRFAFAINKAAGDAESIAGRRMDSVVFTSPMAGFKSHLSSAGISFGRAKEVSEGDIEKCSRRLDIRGAIDSDRREIAHVVPARCMLDGKGVDGNPVGRTAGELRILYHIVSADRERLESVQSVLRSCNLPAKAAVASAYAAGLACLSEEEKRCGAMALDIGKSQISAGIFLGGGFIYGFSLPVGGDYVTNHIAKSTGASAAQAERAKMLCGAAPPDSRDFSEYIEFAGEGAERSITRADMQGVARPVVRLGFDIVAQYAHSKDVMRFVKKIVLAGGGANMDGIAAIAGEAFGLPARAGRPRILNGLGEKYAMPEYAAVLGLAEYVRARSPESRLAEEAPAESWSRRAKKFLARFF